MDVASQRLRSTLRLLTALTVVLVLLQVAWSWPRAEVPGARYLVTSPTGAWVAFYKPNLRGAMGDSRPWNEQALWEGRSPGPIPINPPSSGFVAVSLPGYVTKKLPARNLFGEAFRYPARGALPLVPKIPGLVPLVYAVRDGLWVSLAVVLWGLFWGRLWRPFQQAQRRQIGLRVGLTEGQAQAGVHIDDYEVLEPLGKGGMACVYRVFRRDDPQAERRALKLLTGAQDEESRQRFRREADICRTLEHPHIVHLYDWGQIPEGPYLVLEEIVGPSLAQRLDDGSVPLLQLLTWAHEIAQALEYAHARGVVHRDLKPSNVMVRTATQKAVVMDFGIARKLDLPDVTQAGDVLGTPGYLAPEQYSGVAADYRTDLYALGVLLYEAAAGRLPFPGGNVMEIIHRQLQDDPAPLPEDLPAELRALILRLLSLEPSRRAESTAQVRDELATIIGAL